MRELDKVFFNEHLLDISKWQRLKLWLWHRKNYKRIKIWIRKEGE